MLKHFLILLFLVFAQAGDAVAQTVTVRDFYVRELRDDGYDTIRISRTFLGRLRFTGSQPGRRREIIVNPSNGAVLRDFVRLIESESGEGDGKPPYPGGGRYDDDDDYGDDDEEEDDDQDNSGSGSSSSGSGSGDSDDDDD